MPETRTYTDIYARIKKIDMILSASNFDQSFQKDKVCQMHVASDSNTTTTVTIRLVMLGNQSSGWLSKCSCEGNVCTEVGTRFNVYEISASFPHMWKSQQVTLGVKCDARWVIGHGCVNKGPRRSCVLYICTVFPGLGILVDMSRSLKGPSLQRQMTKKLN